MKLIKPSFEIWEQQSGIDGIYKMIELAGRICYRSENKITEDSAKPFVDRMVKAGHGAMLEHGTVYLNIHWEENIHEVFEDMFKFYTSNPYSKIVRKVINEKDLCPDLFISTNYRVLVEHNRTKDLKYLCEPTKYHEKRITVHFVCDRGILAEFTRHRVFSFSAESTRYCNYSKNKFGNELTFIIPCWLDIPEGEAYWHDGINYRVGATEENPFGESVNFKAWVNKKSNYVEVHDYIQALDRAEKAYFRLMDKWESRVADRRYITGFRGKSCFT